MLSFVVDGNDQAHGWGHRQESLYQGASVGQCNRAKLFDRNDRALARQALPFAILEFPLCALRRSKGSITNSARPSTRGNWLRVIGIICSQSLFTTSPTNMSAGRVRVSTKTRTVISATLPTWPWRLRCRRARGFSTLVAAPDGCASSSRALATTLRASIS